MRNAIIGLLAAGLLAAACGGSGDESTTTSTAAQLSTAEESYVAAFTASGATEGLSISAAIDLGESVCHSLRLLDAAGANGPAAADAIRSVDLDDASAQEMAQYGAALAAAPPYLCPDVEFFGSDVGYWLGI